MKIEYWISADVENQLKLIRKRYLRVKVVQKVFSSDSNTWEVVRNVFRYAFHA
jgi:hypothetical protein